MDSSLESGFFFFLFFSATAQKVRCKNIFQKINVLNNLRKLCPFQVASFEMGVSYFLIYKRILFETDLYLLIISLLLQWEHTHATES